MTANERPDPDALLAAIKREEEQNRKGKLFLFLGMAPGVGKTYAMLETAQMLKNDKIDVIVGVVETHGRLETQNLISGLEVLTRLKLTYRGTQLEEMDLDAILERRPRVVLVDELAHTNVPGSRHPKRWQDVLEILDKGIDVLSTINVQHLESRKEAVEQIAGISVRETVPDTVIDRAFKIRLIDLSPDDLLKRLKEGKVYLGEKAELAAENFFKEDKLTALRELSLRLTAEKVDSELQSFRAARESSGPWRATERLMVAVSHSPYSARLIRATRRIAFTLDAPWVAVNVNDGHHLSDEDEKTLKKNITLARDLGAEVVTTVDVNLLAALTRIAKQKNVTQIILGRPTRRIFKDFIEGGTLLDHLVQVSGDLDIHVLRQDTPPTRQARLFSSFKPTATFGQYAQAFWIIAIAAGVNAGLVNFIGYRAVGFIFLLAVLVLGFFDSLGPVLFAAILSAVVWDYFFIPPVGTWVINAPEDIFMCVAYLFVALITGTLTRRIRGHEDLLRHREERAATLYEVVRDIVSAPSRTVMLAAVNSRLGTFLKGSCAVSLKQSDGQLEPFAGADWTTINTDQKEMAVARWVLDNRRHAGWSTETLGAAEALYLPLQGGSEVLGVLAFKPLKRGTLTREDENFLFTVGRQLAVSLERELFRERAGEALRLEESEKLHQTILNSVSHEIRTPLTAIMGMATALSGNEVSQPDKRRELTRELVAASDRLNHVVENLLDMSRLSTGVLTLKRDWHDVNDVISVSLETLKKTLSGHRIRVVTPGALPLVRIDFRLFEQGLTNLLINAATYSPLGSEIVVEAGKGDDQVFIKVCDEGPGIPDAAAGNIFEKFYRVPGTKPGGTGLGLTIAKSIVETHGGHISFENRLSGGAEFRLSLPVEEQPPMPAERPL